MPKITIPAIELTEFHFGCLAIGFFFTAGVQFGLFAFIWTVFVKCLLGIRWVFRYGVASVVYHSQYGRLPVTRLRTGFVDYGGRTFYRCPNDLETYRLVPRTARLVDGTFQVGDYAMVPLSPGNLTPESALFGSEPLATKSVAPNEWVSVYIVREGGYIYLGAGYREGKFLITAAHVNTDSEGYEIALSRDGVKFFHPTELKKHYLKVDYERATGDDVGGMELSMADWAVLGTRSVKPSVYSTMGSTRIEIYGRDQLGVLKAGVGSLKPPSQAQKKAGLIPHSASTIKGFSGSPAYTLGGTGRKICGLHLAGGDGTVNFMATVHDLHAFRRKVGLAPKPAMVTESVDTKNYQYDRYEEDSEEELEEREDVIAARAAAGLDAYVNENLIDWAQREHDDRMEEQERSGTSRYSVTDAYGISDGFREGGVGDRALGLLPESTGGEGLVISATPAGPPGKLEPAAPTPKLPAPLPIRALDPVKEEEAPRAEEPGGGEDQPAPEFPEGEEAYDEYIVGPLDEPEPRPPAGINKVRSRAKTVSSIAKFLGTTAFVGASVGAAVGMAGAQFKPEWLDCSVSSLQAATTCSYEEMFKSKSFDRFREYCSAAKVEAAEEAKVMKGIDGSDLARVFATGVPNRVRKKALKRLPPDYLEVVKRIGLDPDEFTKWVAPPSGVEAMHDSLASQLGRTKGTCWPEAVREQFARMDGPEYGIFLDEVAKYPANPVRAFGDVHTKVVDFVGRLDGEKSAGWSQYFKPGTKSSWQTEQGLTDASYFARCRLLLRACVGPDLMFQMLPSQLVEAGLSDPRTMFIKFEPHDPLKETQGRWRLIWGASLIDVCTASVTCRKQDKLDIEQYQGGPVKGGHQQAAGLGHHDAGIARLGKEFDRLFKTGFSVFDSDATGYDFSVPRDAIVADAYRRVLLYDGPGLMMFERLAYSEAACNSAHVVLVGGDLWEVLKPGITASGILSTTAQNSFIRALTYALVGIRHVVVAGDDAVGAKPRHFDHVAALAQYGIIEKKVNEFDETGCIEVTSHKFVKGEDGVWRATFCNLGKSCARVVFSDKGATPDKMGGIMYCVRDDSKQLGDFKALAKGMGWPIEGVEPVWLTMTE